MSQIFVSGGQSIGASASVLQMDIQSSFPCRPGNSQESSLAPQFKSINSSVVSLLYGTTLTSVHDYYKSCSLIIWTFVGKVMSLLINALSRFVRAFLPRSRCLLITWLHSLSTVILEPNELNSVTVSTFYASICHEVIGPGAMILVF